MLELKYNLEEKLKIVLLFLFIVVNFNILATVPIEFLFSATHLIFLFILALFYAYYALEGLKTKRIARLTLICLPILLIPFISALQAKANFGQPFIIGLATGRLIFYTVSGAFLIYFLEQGKITMKQVETSVLYVAIIYFIICLSLYIFVNPATLMHTDLVKYQTGKGFTYRLSPLLTVMLLFYALLKGMIEKDKKFLALFLLVMLYLVIFVQGRSLLAAIVGTIGLFFLRNFSFLQNLKYLVLTILLCFGAYAFFMFTNPTIIYENVELFMSAANVFLGGEVTDGSALSRLYEFDIAVRGFKQNPWFGNGFLSNQYNGGFAGLYDHFFPTDIGIMGNLFLYGVIGTSFFYIPFFAAFSYRKYLRHNKDLFLMTCQYSLLFIFAQMFIAARNIQNMGLIIFIFAIIYYFRYYQPQMPAEESST